MIFTPSKYQIDFWNAIEKSNDNIFVSAVPGSGKTTSLVEGLKRVPRYKKTIFLAFSKAIQLELKNRVPDHVDCMTLHSLGYKALWRHYKTSLKLTGYKTFQFSKDVVEGLKMNDKELSDKDKLIYKFTISDLIDMARINLDTSLAGFKYVEQKYDIFCKNGEIENAAHVFDKLFGYNRKHHKEVEIDYVDMLYLPIQFNMSLPKYDFVAVDECQDLNPVQLELISRILKPKTGRLVATGDVFQSIFSFAGASVDSVDKLRNRFNMKELPLSITYRLPKIGVKKLQRINPSLEGSETAIEGKIIYNGNLLDCEEGDLVICRNTKPLIIAYFILLEQEKKVTIVGKEMEKGLLKLIKSYDGLNSDGVRYTIDKEKEEMINALINQGITEPEKHWKFITFAEKVEILLLFLDRYKEMYLVKEKIEEIFDEKKPGIKLMTVHKSKGLEADRVFFITHFDNDKLIPSKYATTPEQKQQELNLLYVGESRFKREMHYIKLL